MDTVSRFAANNAAWIQAAVSALGLPGEFTPVLWQNHYDMPPIFPNADTLGGTESEQLAAVSALIKRRPGRVTVVKDAWARLDLTPLGFEPLFEASWIYRHAIPLVSPGAGLQPEHLTTAEGLRAFAAACNGEELAGVYSPKLLNRPDIAWIAAHREGNIIGGVTAFLAHGMNGINNLFAPDNTIADSLIRAAVNAFPDVPACGYEGEDTVAPFLALGFQTMGKLRVWIRRT
ncbi:MAG: hypothetical protein H6671_15885 [Anaerolineaceae bacterium]|nr:hypothetical protein [Anaerolineaceae bacterium]